MYLLRDNLLYTLLQNLGYIYNKEKCYEKIKSHRAYSRAITL